MAAPENELGPAPTTSAVMDRRATLLVDLYSRALDATLKKVTYENFAACFPTPAQYRPETLRMFWKDFVEKLAAKNKDSFEKTLEERNVIQSLNALDRLIVDAVNRKKQAEQDGISNQVSVQIPTPPHTMSPYTLMAAHLAPLLTSQESALKASISTLEEQNNTLAETIVQQQADMDTLIKKLESLVTDLQKAADMVQAPELQLATQDARNIHNELRDPS